MLRLPLRLIKKVPSRLYRPLSLASSISVRGHGANVPALVPFAAPVTDDAKPAASKFAQISKNAAEFIAKDKQLFNMVVEYVFSLPQADPEMMQAIAVTCHDTKQFRHLMQKFRTARATGYAMRIFEAQMLLSCCERHGTILDALEIFSSVQVGPGDVIAAAPRALLPFLMRQCYSSTDVLRIYNAITGKHYKSVTDTPVVFSSVFDYCMQHGRDVAALDLLLEGRKVYADSGTWANLGGYLKNNYIIPSLQAVQACRQQGEGSKSFGRRLLAAVLPSNADTTRRNINAGHHHLVDKHGFVRHHVVDVVGCYIAMASVDTRTNAAGAVQSFLQGVDGATADFCWAVENSVRAYHWRHNNAGFSMVSDHLPAGMRAQVTDVGSRYLLQCARAALSVNESVQLEQLAALLRGMDPTMLGPAYDSVARITFLAAVAGSCQRLHGAQDAATKCIGAFESVVLPIVSLMEVSFCMHPPTRDELLMMVLLSRCLDNSGASLPVLAALLSRHEPAVADAFNSDADARCATLLGDTSCLSAFTVDATELRPIYFAMADAKPAVSRIEIFDPAVLDDDMDENIVLECRERLTFPDAREIDRQATAFDDPLVQMSQLRARLEHLVEWELAVQLLRCSKTIPHTEPGTGSLQLWNQLLSGGRTSRSASLSSISPDVVSALPNTDLALLAGWCTAMAMNEPKVPLGKLFVDGHGEFAALCRVFMSAQRGGEWHRICLNTELLRSCVLALTDLLLLSSANIAKEPVLKTLSALVHVLEDGKASKCDGGSAFEARDDLDPAASMYSRAVLLYSLGAMSLSHAYTYIADPESRQRWQVDTIPAMLRMPAAVTTSLHSSVDFPLRTLQRLFHVSLALNQSQVANSIYWHMRSAAFEDPTAGAALVRALCAANDYIGALLVWTDINCALSSCGTEDLVCRAALATALANASLEYTRAAEGLSSQIRAGVVDSQSGERDPSAMLRSLVSSCSLAAPVKLMLGHASQVLQVSAEAKASRLRSFECFSPVEFGLPTAPDVVLLAQGKPAKVSLDGVTTQAMDVDPRRGGALKTSLLSSLVQNPVGAFGLPYNRGDISGCYASMVFATGTSGRLTAIRIEEILSKPEKEMNVANKVLQLKTCLAKIADATHADAVHLLSEIDIARSSDATVAAIAVSTAANAWAEVVDVLAGYIGCVDRMGATPDRRVLEAFIQHVAGAVQSSYTPTSHWIRKKASSDELQRMDEFLTKRLTNGDKEGLQDKKGEVVVAAKMARLLGTTHHATSTAVDSSYVELPTALPHCLDAASSALRNHQADPSVILLACAVAGLRALRAHNMQPATQTVSAVLAALDRRMRYDRMGPIFQELRDLNILPL